MIPVQDTDEAKDENAKAFEDVHLKSKPYMPIEFPPQLKKCVVSLQTSMISGSIEDFFSK